uniref:TcuA: flavoprotein used to oxidize tricarballylate to cis-aconitate n=1 Tax=uncultured Thiotrichaceae bacterium TaxID=298394 RepID=A0A6S6UMJ8_9GAMM|nr:MAG: TcuA: flavoprotein used to oxidize tricarballylate to cis-aconitate [uncultured Thiotrichaceae bacterium]
MNRPDKTYDVIVIGGGNAALCAAITAREHGADVLLLEHAPKNMRGGNSRHTRNLRLAHDEPTSVLTDDYLVEEYFADLLKVTAGNTNEALAKMVLDQSRGLQAWMEAHGVNFQPSLSGTLSLGRTNAFFLGGGKALVNAYYVTAEDIGVDIRYETEVLGLVLDGKHCTGVTTQHNAITETISCKSVVVVSGGFQANDEWMREAWGEVADNFLIRGTPFNKGRVLRDLRDQGCAVVGDETQGHMVAIDGRAPKYDGGISTRLDCVPFSVVVNKDAQRFYDEGEDFWPKRYAIWGRLVANQPDQVGYAIIDSKSLELFMPSVFTPYQSDTLAGLAEKMGLESESLESTIAEFNEACQSGEFDTTTLDGVATQGLQPDKTNWARPVNKAPFYGYVLRPGVTFTYLSLQVNDKAEVLWADGAPTDNIYAAGEVMAGNILGQGYLAGLGMTIGTVFGRIAGKEAAAS